MHLFPEVWSCDERSKHQVCKVTFDSSDIRRAGQIASKKLEYIDAHSPGGELRDPRVIRSRIAAGKLADAAVIQYLGEKANELGVEIELQEYDSIRSDGFRNRDPYDIAIKHKNQEFRRIEVRSSFCYKTRPKQNIMRALSIYGWYVTRNKRSEDEQDWYWQFVYYLRPRDCPAASGVSNIPVFEDCLNGGAVEGYIVGGATRDMLRDPLRSVERKDQDGALYRAISPIYNGLDCDQMIQAVLAT